MAPPLRCNEVHLRQREGGCRSSAVRSSAELQTDTKGCWLGSSMLKKSKKRKLKARLLHGAAGRGGGAPITIFCGERGGLLPQGRCGAGRRPPAFEDGWGARMREGAGAGARGSYPIYSAAQSSDDGEWGGDSGTKNGPQIYKRGPGAPPEGMQALHTAGGEEEGRDPKSPGPQTCLHTPCLCPPLRMHSRGQGLAARAPHYLRSSDAGPEAATAAAFCRGARPRAICSGA